MKGQDWRWSEKEKIVDGEVLGGGWNRTEKSAFPVTPPRPHPLPTFLYNEKLEESHYLYIYLYLHFNPNLHSHHTHPPSHHPHNNPTNPQNKVQAALRSKLDEAISVKRSQVETVSPWAFVAFFRYLAMVQVTWSIGCSVVIIVVVVVVVVLCVVVVVVVVVVLCVLRW
jgi:hypothetical protein